MRARHRTHEQIPLARHALALLLLAPYAATTHIIPGHAPRFHLYQSVGKCIACRPPSAVQYPLCHARYGAQAFGSMLPLACSNGMTAWTAGQLHLTS